VCSVYSETAAETPSAEQNPDPGIFRRGQAPGVLGRKFFMGWSGENPGIIVRRSAWVTTLPRKSEANCEMNVQILTLSSWRKFRTHLGKEGADISAVNWVLEGLWDEIWHSCCI